MIKVIKEEFVVIGKEGSTSDGEGFIQKLWNDANGHAKCGVNGSEVIAHTTRVVVNGWVNYGPWNPRPGIGVIW